MLLVVPTTAYNEQERTNSGRQQNLQLLSRQERIYESNGGSRVRVVQHFEIAFTKNEVRWPGTRNRKHPPNV